MGSGFGFVNSGRGGGDLGCCAGFDGGGAGVGATGFDRGGCGGSLGGNSTRSDEIGVGVDGSGVNIKLTGSITLGGTNCC